MDDTDAVIRANPIINGFRAMALRQLGRDKEASAILRRLRRGIVLWEIRHVLLGVRVRG